tara:strand:- start:124 stop:411 length:288 start_codon:yes stop_codon:yes gene_type:complete
VLSKEAEKGGIEIHSRKEERVIDCGLILVILVFVWLLCLKDLKRSYIIVYCIDPSKEKCNFMKQVCKLNNLDETNIKIINKSYSTWRHKPKKYKY